MMWDIDSLFYDGNNQDCNEGNQTSYSTCGQSTRVPPKPPPMQDIMLSQAFTGKNKQDRSSFSELQNPPSVQDLFLSQAFKENARNHDLLSSQAFKDNTSNHDLLPSQAFKDNTSNRDLLPSQAFKDNASNYDHLTSQGLKDNTSNRLVKKRSFVPPVKSPPSTQDLFLSQALKKKNRSFNRTQEENDDFDLTQAFTRRSPINNSQSFTQNKMDAINSLCSSGDPARQGQNKSSLQDRIQKYPGFKNVLPFSDNHDNQKPMRSQKIGIVAPSKVPTKRKPERSYGLDIDSDFLQTPQSLTLPGPDDQGNNVLKLKPTSEIPEKFRGVFPFPYFNAVQSKVFNDVMTSDYDALIHTLISHCRNKICCYIFFQKFNLRTVIVDSYIIIFEKFNLRRVT